MKNYHNKTKLQLIEEIKSLKNRIEELEQSDFKYKNAEEKLKESEEKYRLAMEATNDGLWDWNVKGNKTYFNPAAYRIFGCKPGELKPDFQFWKSCVHPDDLQSVVDNLDSHLDGKTEAYQAEYRITTKNGDKKWLLSRGKVVERDLDGSPIRVTGTDIDITARKQADEELQKSEERFRQIVERSSDIFYRQNINTSKFEYMSAKVNDIFGRTPEEMYSMDLEEQKALVHPDDLPDLIDFAKDLVRADSKGIGHIEREFRTKSKPGEYKWIHGSYNLVRNANGKPEFIVGGLQDITERKRAEEELQKSYNIINQSLAVVFHWRNAECWPVEYVSRNVKDLFGYSAEEFISGAIPYESVIHPDDLGRVLEEVLIYSKDKGLTEFTQEYKIVTKEGETKWIEDRTSIRRNEKGEITHYQGIVLNITKRKQADEALIESRQILSDVLNTIPVRVFWKDLESVYLGCNQLFAQDAGRSNPEEMIGDNDYNMGWAEQAEMYRSDDKDVIESVQPKINYEEPQTTPEGKTIWLRTSKIPLWNSTGNVYGVLGTYEDITERKNAEETLQRSEAMFKGIFSQAPIGIELYDSQGSLINANQECLNIFGVSNVEEVKGFKLFEDPNMSEEAKVQLRKGLPIDFESEFDFEVVRKLKLYKTTKSGKCFLQVQITPYQISDCGERGFVVHVQNITERKKADQALRNSEYLLSESQKVARLGYYELDILRGNWTSSKILDEIFGIDDNFIKKVEAWSDILHPDSQEEMLTYFNEYILKQHQKFDKEYRIIRISNGEERWVHGLGELEYDSDGNPVKMIGTIQDITKQKRSEEALQKSRERYRSLYQKTPAMLHSIDQEGRLTNVSEYWLKKTGYSLNEVLGRHSTDFMTKESSRFAKEVILPRFYETGSCRDVPYQYVKKNGEVMDALLSAITENDESGELTHSLSVIIDVTERKKAEEALRENEEKLRNIVEYSTNLFYSHTPDHVVTYISPQTRNFFDCEPEEALTRWTEFVTDNPLNDKGFKFTEKAIKTGERQPVYEFELVGMKGRKIWVEVSEAPIVENGKTVAIVGALIDITERKKAEEAHRESEERFSRLSEAAFEGIAISDSGKIIDVNNQLARILGYKPEEIIGKTAMEFVAPESRELVMNKIKSATESSYEHFALKNDGSILPVEVQAKTLPYEGRSFRVTTIRDITERKKAEEALKESEEKFRNLSDNSPNMIFINQGGKIVYANKRCEEYLGYTRDEFYSSHFDFRKLIDPEYMELMTANIKRNMEGQEVPPGEYELRAKSGQRIESIINTKLISYGGKQAILGIITDITERKLAEKRIRDSHNKLRSLAERLQMIREEERATIAREIHDDLGQSLTALKMDISWVKNNPEMDVEAKTAKFDTMLDLTNSTIQTVKRIATELRPGILDDLGLVPAIEWQAAEFQNRFKIQCNVSINKSDIIIKDQISIAVFRIFQETLTNVARHSGATKVDIKLNFHVDNELFMEIADNGVGIDEEQINSSKSLGLFGMRERVNILNGEMEITSKHGKGTMVRVSIPDSKEDVGNNK